MKFFGLIAMVVLLSGCPEKEAEQCLSVAMKTTKDLRSEGWQFHGVVREQDSDTGIFTKGNDVLNLLISKEKPLEVEGWTIVNMSVCEFEGVEHSVTMYKRN